MALPALELILNMPITVSDSGTNFGGYVLWGGGGEFLKSQVWPEMHSNFTVNWQEHLEPGILAS